jgi:hypothetical protein
MKVLIVIVQTNIQQQIADLLPAVDQVLERLRLKTPNFSIQSFYWVTPAEKGGRL